jgi:hypothetical protein
LCRFFSIVSISSQRFLLACGSSPVVGSSRNISFGLLMSVVAIEKSLLLSPGNLLQIEFASVL